MRVKVKRIDPLQLGKMLAVIYALFGLIFVPILLFMAIAEEGGAAGLGMAVLIPIFYVVVGFIGGIIGAFIYNLVAGWVGGVEVDFDADQELT